MCGIAGIVDWRTGAGELGERCRAMTQRLANRGPDGEGLHEEPGVALGHRRLSIIDLSERGRQPMSNEAGTVWLTFNGEIYNYRELRDELERRGRRFRSDSDTEVLLHLYEGSSGDLRAFVRRLRGMFAFAIWDRERRRLLLARDRLGIKPLVYHARGGLVAFASDLDALLAHPEVPRALDWTSLFEYLVLHSVPGPWTIFRDARCVEPGTLLVADERGVEEIRYWQLEARERVSGEVDRAVERELEEAVDYHLVADVDVGAFLSGGVDSGLVCSMASERLDAPLQTFSATFPGEAVDEGPWAMEAASAVGARHTEFAVTNGFFDGIERVVAAMDQPLAIPAAVSLFHLSRNARERVKVVLTGDGGDEIFAGYARHRPYAVPSSAAWIPPSARRDVGRLGRAILPEWARGRAGLLGRAHAMASALARDEAELYAPRLHFLDPASALALLPPDAAREIDLTRYDERVRSLFAECPYDDVVSRMLYVDLKTTLVDEMLAKVDRMTMAWGLEARVPLLDHRVVELAMQIPGGVKRDGETGKLPLRRIVAARLGDDVAWRGKHGFNAPLDVWLGGAGETREAFERLWPLAVESGVFDAEALEAIRRRPPREGEPHALNLFSILVYGLWASERGVRP